MMFNILKRDFTFWKQEVATQPGSLNLFKPYHCSVIFSSAIFLSFNILEKNVWKGN